jgi:Nif-specific regulatory protein
MYVEAIALQRGIVPSGLPSRGSAWPAGRSISLTASTNGQMKTNIYELEVQTLYAISQKIGQVLNLDQTLMAILEILSRNLSMERGTVTLKDRATDLLRIIASHGLDPQEQERGIYQPGEGITGSIFETAQPFAVPDIGKEPLFLNRTQARRLTKKSLAFIGVPIVLNHEPIGVLSVDRLFGPEVDFEEDIRFLTIVAVLMAQFVQVNRQVARREEHLLTENRSLRAEVSAKYNHFFAVGVSPAMQTLNKMIQKVAPSRASVLLLGESGTGKTLTARIIHELSQRRRNPFAKVNCAALPDNLIESELFGHERGAFTGATQLKKGRLEDAHSGTVFLDEIGELPLAVQAKLLRFLQDREFERLGSTQTRKVDVRIIAATNVDLNQAVEDGRFRSDLFYRLNVFPISIPPLRRRKADLPLLIDYFIARTAREYGRQFYFSSECMEILAAYNWPGNVRELENLIERVAIMAESNQISASMLPAYLFSRKKTPLYEAPSTPTISRLEMMERETVLEALARNDWVQQRAARDIGLTLRQMGYRVKKFKLDKIIRENKQRDTSYKQLSN